MKPRRISDTRVELEGKSWFFAEETVEKAVAEKGKGTVSVITGFTTIFSDIADAHFSASLSKEVSFYIRFHVVPVIRNAHPEMHTIVFDILSDKPIAGTTTIVCATKESVLHPIERWRAGVNLRSVYFLIVIVQSLLVLVCL